MEPFGAGTHKSFETEFGKEGKKIFTESLAAIAGNGGKKAG